jgi:hypothetical protein
MKTTKPLVARSSLDFLEVLEKASHLINQSDQRELLRDINNIIVSYRDPKYKIAGTYQESCPLGVLELRTSMHLTSICTLGSSWSWNVRHLIVVYSGG